MERLFPGKSRGVCKSFIALLKPTIVRLSRSHLPTSHCYVRIYSSHLSDKRDLFVLPPSFLLIAERGRNKFCTFSSAACAGWRGEKKNKKSRAVVFVVMGLGAKKSFFFSGGGRSGSLYEV